MHAFILILLVNTVSITAIWRTTPSLSLPTAELEALEAQLVEAIETIFRQSIKQHKHFNLYVYKHYELQQYRYHLEDLASQLLVRAFPDQLYSISCGENRPEAHYVLVLVDTLASLRTIYVDKATGNISYTIVYIATLHDHLHEDVQAALQLFWQLSILNVGIILRHVEAPNELLLVTYFPFGASGCQHIKATIINRFNLELGVWAMTLHFPQKLRNFLGCTLTCATWEDMPYLVVQHNAAGDVSFIGIEGALLQFMADNLNFTIGLYILNREQVLATFNETGWIFNEIFASAADYALGGFHNKPAQNHVVPYSQSTYYFMSRIMLVTNLQFAYSTYEKLAFPFHSYVWLAVGLTFAVGCSVICALRSRWTPLAWRHFVVGACATPYYNMFVLAMGAAMRAASLPLRNFARFLLCLWLLGTMILRSAYQSGMYQMLRDNTQRNPPQTIDAVLAQDYVIAMIPENVRFLNSLPELQHRQLQFLNTSELSAFPMLARDTARRMAIITPYEYFGYYRMLHTSNRRLHLVRERVFTQQLSFYVRHNSYLVEVLNAQIQQAHSFGFLEHWTRRYVGAVDDNVDYTATVVDEHSGDETTDSALVTTNSNSNLNVLSMKELAGIFWIVLWLHLCATIVFGLEIMTKKMQILKSFVCLC